MNTVLQELLDNFDPKAAHERAVRAALQERLLALSFHGFEHLVKDLLTRLGYSEARLLDRTQWRQATRHGGRDMEAFAVVGLSKARIVLQIKQYRRPVSRRFIDELAGIIQRLGAREGIVITTSRFSRAAMSAAQSYRQASIRLIDGEELVSLLHTHQVGTFVREQDGETRVSVDTAYFALLDANYPRKETPEPALSRRKHPRALRSLPTPARFDSPNPCPMLWRTHFLAGVNSLWLLYPFPGVLTAETLPLAIGFVALGSLLPDLDAVESKVKHVGAFGITPFAPLSRLANRTLGHRGLMHSPISLVLVAFTALVLSYWIGVVPGISLILGYGSHLVLDAMTKSGISLRPFSDRRLHLLPPRLRIVTGSVQEDAVMLTLGLLAALFLLHFLPRMNTYP